MLTRRRVLTLAALQLTLPAALGLLARDSRAQGPKPRVEFLVLYAKQDPKIDPKVPSMGPGVPRLPQLLQPPFNAYNTFAFVSQSTLTLDQPKSADPWKGKPSATYEPVPGKSLQIAVIEQLADKRFHMGLAIGKETPDVVRWDAPAGETVFIAGQHYKDGILVMGITLRGGGA